MARQDAPAHNDPVLTELQSIKRLLILLLAERGAQQEEIATALNVSQSSVSKMFPKGMLTHISKRD